eukprot:6351066-Amphidinium_carterae.1
MKVCPPFSESNPLKGVRHQAPARAVDPVAGVRLLSSSGSWQSIHKFASASTRDYFCATGLHPLGFAWFHLANRKGVHQECGLLDLQALFTAKTCLCERDSAEVLSLRLRRATTEPIRGRGRHQ